MRPCRRGSAPFPAASKSIGKFVQARDHLRSIASKPDVVRHARFPTNPTLLRLLMVPYALTIFTGAFLLFQVQPLIGKYILPWFGGGPGVWTTCMLFFQVLLLGGYAYAHFSSKWLKPRVQIMVHLALLAAAVAL